MVIWLLQKNRRQELGELKLGFKSPPDGELSLDYISCVKYHRTGRDSWESSLAGIKQGKASLNPDRWWKQTLFPKTSVNQDFSF